MKEQIDSNTIIVEADNLFSTMDGTSRLKINKETELEQH
jgi:hypothetical protein